MRLKRWALNREGGQHERSDEMERQWRWALDRRKTRQMDGDRSKSQHWAPRIALARDACGGRGSLALARCVSVAFDLIDGQALER